MITRNEVPIHAITWMNLENVMLRERSQSQKPHYCMIPFIFSVKKKKLTDPESRLAIT